MRISETKLVQIVDSQPPKLVIVEETDGSEIVFSYQEVCWLYMSLVKFIPELEKVGS